MTTVRTAFCATPSAVPVSLSRFGQPPDGDSLPKTRQEFLDKYGTDDSSRALIRFYFYKQRNTGTQGVLMSVLFVVGVMFLIVAISNRNQPPNVINEGDPSVGVLGGFMIAGAAAIGITTLIRSGRFRKKLDFELKDYQNTRYINPRIARSLIFRLCLKGEPRDQLRLYKKEIRGHQWRRKSNQ